MRKVLASLSMVKCVMGLIFFTSNHATARFNRFWFSEEDLWNHTEGSNAALYDQDAPWNHHTSWKANVQTTDSAAW